MRRLAAADMAKIQAALPAPATAEEAQPQDQDLAGLVSRRAEFLENYQNRAYAGRYEAFVATVAGREAAVLPGSDKLAKAVARYLFKLMAYKDEYEVARLYTDGAFMNKLKAQFSGDYKLTFHMAPPILTRSGANGEAPAKITLGAWMMPAMKLLARMKGLRGTMLDPFGRSEERQTERRLIEEYQALLQNLLADLTPDNHDTAVKLAEIPEHIRGYGHVKTRHLAQAKETEADLLRRFHGEPAIAGQAAE